MFNRKDTTPDSTYCLTCLLYSVVITASHGMKIVSGVQPLPHLATASTRTGSFNINERIRLTHCLVMDMMGLTVKLMICIILCSANTIWETTDDQISSKCLVFCPGLVEQVWLSSSS